MFKSSPLILAVALTLPAISCKKEEPVPPDTIQPVITLVGAYEQEVTLNEAYTEMGATAKDNEDGDISSAIAISGAVDINKTGEYRMYYDVEDLDGNKAATATRYVNVVNTADFMIGTYMAEPSCSGTGTTPDYNTMIIPSETVNNRVLISRVLWFVNDDPVEADISGTDITIPLQNVGEMTVEGTGTFTGVDFSLDVEIDGVSGYTCTVAHTKS